MISWGSSVGYRHTEGTTYGDLQMSILCLAFCQCSHASCCTANFLHSSLHDGTGACAFLRSRSPRTCTYTYTRMPHVTPREILHGAFRSTGMCWDDGGQIETTGLGDGTIHRSCPSSSSGILFSTLPDAAPSSHPLRNRNPFQFRLTISVCNAGMSKASKLGRLCLLVSWLRRNAADQACPRRSIIGTSTVSPTHFPPTFSFLFEVLLFRERACVRACVCVCTHSGMKGHSFM